MRNAVQNCETLSLLNYSRFTLDFVIVRGGERKLAKYAFGQNIRLGGQVRSRISATFKAGKR
jgi:hypothetical protein